MLWTGVKTNLLLTLTSGDWREYPFHRNWKKQRHWQQSPVPDQNREIRQKDFSQMLRCHQPWEGLKAIDFCGEDSEKALGCPVKMASN